MVSNVDGDLGQLSRLLRKNILFSTVQGIRSVVRLYGEIGTDQLIDISEDDYVINSINTEITKHDEQYALEDEDLMFGTQIQFCSLAPKPFLNICKSSGFSTDYLNEILQPSKFLQDALKNQKFSEGKSGSFFVFSPDKKLIIKTIPEHEFSSMKHLIKDYYEHLMKNPDSLLIRLLGAFSLTFVHTKVYIIFMANLFTMPVHEKYDLKGSWVARTASESSSVKKDNDFTSTILMDAEHAKFFVNQIRADTAVLCKHNIMDYSLLLGVIPRNKKDNNKKLKNSSAISLEDLSTRDEENVDLESEPERTSPLPRTTFTSPDGELSYVISIIDILQTYNLDKRMERITKVYALCKDKQGLSVQEPEVYRSRFVEKMSQHIQIQKYL
uniref:PIPK domain-containing protein n=1 Tax=Arcella intermedia TaxID=1963864 RepID=A0A6B2L6A1_9EUKA